MADIVNIRPKLIVFDLDQTLWPFWVDTHISYPVRKWKDDVVVDNSGLRIDCFSEVPKILRKLRENGFILAVASSTTEITGAQKLLEMFDLQQFFSYVEIFPDNKTNHLTKIQQRSGVRFNEMLFFDDEERNITSGVLLGITSVQVKNGITAQIIEDSLLEFANKKS